MKPNVSGGPGALVQSGPKQLQKSHKGSKRNEQGQLPTTSRALVLRNGKDGARGTGEVLAITKISGREKLDILAEDLTRRSQKAVMRRFNIVGCLNICESQSNVFLDDICRLKDPDLFYDTIIGELKSRTADGQQVDRSPSNVADVVSTRIHNSFMLASAWHIAFKHLNDLRIDGLEDGTIEQQLRGNQDLRDRYLFVCQLVQELSNLSQARVATLAITTPHYAPYFKKKAKTHQVEFDWQKLREAGRSFLDSIILELCFPRAPYSQAVLFDILHDAVDESPRDAKRFPQALFDAVGDFAVVVQIQQMLEAPLLSTEGRKWMAQKPEYPDDYKQWLSAQAESEAASNKHDLFKHLIYPLERAKESEALQKMWRVLNETYQKVSGVDIEKLWQLPSAFELRTSWTAVYKKPSHSDRRANESSDDEDQLPRRVTSKKKPLPLKNGGEGDEDSTGSMPDLQSVSNSSEDEEEDSDAETDDDEEHSENESEYDSDYEDEMRDFLREAMGTVHEIDVLQGTPVDPLGAEDRDGNPFLKILGSLRGRMFSSKSKLKTGGAAKSQGAKPTTTQPPFAASKSPLVPPPPPSSGPKTVTIEEVADEEEVAAKKKKKKKKKTKKKKAPVLEPVEEVPSSPPLPPTPSAPKASPAKKAPATTTTAGYVPPYLSSASLASTTTAQSARAYLQSEKLDDSKDKVKTRGGHASLFSSGANLFSRFSSKDRSKSTVEKEKKARHSWFTHISKRAHDTLDQLFHLDDAKAKPMKWDHFVKMMTEMGFSIDPSPSGSSVRFDPPNPADQSISVHKPHPDAVFPPHVVLDIGKRLQRHYGWTKEDLAALKGKR